MHPTKKILVDTAIRLLDIEPALEVTIDLVLTESNISRGSLYHHFEDFNELIEVAHVQRYSAYVDSSIALLTKVLRHATSRNQMIEKVREVTIITQSADLRSNRFKRVQTLALASKSPRMARSLALEQNRLTATIADLYREVVEKGWGNQALSPNVIGVMIQAYSLGKVVDDFSLNPMNSAQWNELINYILEEVFFPA
jgi:AcrR family transcriptional regulator